MLCATKKKKNRKQKHYVTAVKKKKKNLGQRQSGADKTADFYLINFRINFIVTA